MARPDCPLHLEMCYPSCHWWIRDFKCGYDRAVQKEVADLQAMKEASRLYRPPQEEVKE